jgi:hypothetical protein
MGQHQQDINELARIERICRDLAPAQRQRMRGGKDWSG